MADEVHTSAQKLRARTCILCGRVVSEQEEFYWGTHCAECAARTLDAVSTGRGPAPGQPYPGLVLLDGGADDLPGRRLTPLWGCMPAAPAFDLAAAALLIRQGAEERVDCLARTEDGDFGLIRLGPCRR